MVGGVDMFSPACRLPHLPLRDPDPLAATLGIMLYPGDAHEECQKAAAFALKVLTQAGALSKESAGLWPEDGLRSLVESAGAADNSGDEHRVRYGSAVGLTVMYFHQLAMAEDKRASWATAQQVVLRSTGLTAQDSVSTSQLKQQRSRFMPVAHLWGAYAYRNFRFSTDEDVGYDGVADFQSFLTEAEILRQWGTRWRQDRAKSSPPFSKINMWRPPDDWDPPARLEGWPQTGVIPVRTIEEQLLRGIKTAGNPKPRKL